MNPGSPSTNGGAAITFVGVTKRYRGHLALNDLSLRVAKGCVFGLLGPNGAGKTTTLRLITGVLGPDSGSVTVLDEIPGVARARVGFLPEEKGLYRRMRVLEYLVFFARLKGMNGRDAVHSAMRALERFGIADRAHNRCEALSKGLGQKLQIATALVHDPELIVLDEPFSGLDPVNVDLVRTLVKELRDRGRTVLLSTHDMAQAELLCDELLLLDRGNNILAGRTSSILSAGPPRVRVAYRGQAPDFARLPGVVSANDTGQHVELGLHANADPQTLLRALLDCVTVESFDTRSASLHEIFISRVGRTIEPATTATVSQA